MQFVYVFFNHVDTVGRTAFVPEKMKRKKKLEPTDRQNYGRRV